MNMQTPRYEYSRAKIQERITQFNKLTAPYGLIVRYALKANPHPEILAQLHKGDIQFDASSSYEAADLLAQGIPGNCISLSSQQSPHNLEELLSKNVLFIATTLHQLDQFLALSKRPNTVGIRINPAMGHGHNNRTSTGGVSASFGIWHEYIPQVLERAREKGVRVDRLHIHIGSGTDSSVWDNVIVRSLEIAEQFPDVTSLNIGGGFKVHRFGEEKEGDMEMIMGIFSKRLETFASQTGRKLKLEIEPGTYFIAHAGTLIAKIDDIVDTGEGGYHFLRLNTGMNDFLRSTMYGAQHEIEVCNDVKEKREYVVVGHNCESGDIFTPAPADPEGIAPRLLNVANIGDEIRIYDTGAYCASMRAKGYNSFPDAVEVMVD